MTLKYRVNIESDSLNESFEVEGVTFYIGRSDQADITVKNALFSRKHIKVKSKEGALYVQDLDTTNGTALNGKKLDAHEWYEFTNGDEIKVGDEILVYVTSLEQKEKSKVINLNEIKEQQLSSEAKTTIHHRPVSNPDATIVGNAARDLQQQFVQEQAPSGTGIYHTDELKSVLNRVEEKPETQFSEIELLEIKKIEIESQVKALKIREESEQEALKILDKAKQEASFILNNAHEKSIQVMDSAEDKRDELLAKAKAESDRMLEETTALCNEEKRDLEEKISDLKLDIDYLKKEKHESSNKLEKINEDISEALKQKQNLELRSDSIRDRISVTEKQFEELQEKFKNAEIEYGNQKTDLDNLKFDLDRIERENKNLIEEKESLLGELDNLRDKEVQINASIDKNQERLDKFFDIKEEISQENKRLEEKLETLQKTENSLTDKIEELETDIRQKKDELHSIAEDAKTYFDTETKKYNDDLNKRKAQEEERFVKLKQDNDQRANALMAETKERVAKLEADSQALFEEAKLAEVEAKELADKARDEAESKAEKLNDELLRKLHDANTEVKEMQEKALKEYQDTLVSAKEKAQVMLEAAQATADEKLENAKNEANEMFQSGRNELLKAQEKATELVRLAQEKTAQVHADALKNLETAKAGLVKENETLKKSNKDLSNEKTKLKTEIDHFQANIAKKTKELEDSMIAQKNSMLEAAKNETNALKEKAYAELKQIQEKIQKLEENQLKEVENSIAEKHKQEREKFELELKQERETIAQLKAKEITKLKKLQDLEDDKIAKRKKEYMDVITAGVVNVVNMKIKELAKKKVLGDDARIDEENVRSLIKSALIDDNPEKNQLLKKLKANAGSGAGKSAENTKKAAIAGAVGVFVIILGIIFSDSIGSLFSSIGDALTIETSSKDVFMQQLKEREKYLANFNPTQTKEFKDTYTDNILYNEYFMEIYLQDEFRSKWLIAFRKYLVEELDQPPTKAIPFMTDEQVLVAKLAEIRKIIRKDTKDARIKEMRDVENKEINKLIKHVGGQENYILLQEFAGEYFTKYRKDNFSNQK